MWAEIGVLAVTDDSLFQMSSLAQSLSDSCNSLLILLYSDYTIVKIITNHDLPSF
jgi:hypothetical protein